MTNGDKAAPWRHEEEEQRREIAGPKGFTNLVREKMHRAYEAKNNPLAVVRQGHASRSRLATVGQTTSSHNNTIPGNEEEK